ncbi:MAG: TetR/AcrR family transcriptional regulator [Marinobacter sp.]|uniref:TetR/AcrR family transcriptional regulator n=1 Tax=Marinobacter sp. TaxID=50741 RepID=UPI003F9D4A00
MNEQNKSDPSWQHLSPPPSGQSKVKVRPGRIRQRNREQILAAAEKEFSRKGFGATTVQQIADRAGLPKSNVLYYFSNKKRMYYALMDGIMGRWNDVFSNVRPEDDPATTLAGFIQVKMEMSRTHPLASRLFAMEIIQGAPVLKEYLSTSMKDWVRERAMVIQQWINTGRMGNVDPVQLIHLIWSSTQHYADFQVQILAIEEKEAYTKKDFKHAAEFLTQVILRGCGLEVPE